MISTLQVRQFLLNKAGSDSRVPRSSGTRQPDLCTWAPHPPNKLPVPASGSCCSVATLLAAEQCQPCCWQAAPSTTSFFSPPLLPRQSLLCGVRCKARRLFSFCSRLGKSEDCQDLFRSAKVFYVPNVSMKRLPPDHPALWQPFDPANKLDIIIYKRRPLSTRVLTAKFRKSKANLPATESWQRSDCTTASAGWCGSLCPLVFKSQKKRAGRGASALLGLGLCPHGSWQPFAECPGELSVGLQAAGSSCEFEQPCKAVPFQSVAFLGN